MRSTRGGRLALTVAVAGVWLVNGLYAKVLGGAPRHTAIVARVLGQARAPVIVVAIGLGEVALGLWILSGRHPRQTAALQIALVLTMNVLERRRAVDMLLWGRLNFAFAVIYCVLVAYHGFWVGGHRRLGRA